LNIIDIFEALTSKRIYKEIWPKKKTLNFFINNTHLFDPNIIEVFLDNFDELYRVKNDPDYRIEAQASIFLC